VGSNGLILSWQQIMHDRGRKMQTKIRQNEEALPCFFIFDEAIHVE
jgi:hypothetical protein